MAYCSSKNCSKRNLCIKAVISILLTLGMVCAIFAMRSCQWFLFEQDEFSDNRPFQGWTFLPERDTNKTTSIGIFRYKKALIDYDDDDSNMTVISTLLKAENEEYISTNNDQCVSYTGFWVGTDHKWKFTAQLCIMSGTIFAFGSLCVIIAGAYQFPICNFLLLTTGLQSATIISSLSWCDQYWNCPWLLGALANLVAACLYLLCWVLATCGMVELKAKNPSSTDDQQKQKGKQKQKQSSNNESTDSGGSHSSSGIARNNDGEIDLETGGLRSGPNTNAPYPFSKQLSNDSNIQMSESSKSKDDDDDGSKKLRFEL